MLHPINPPSCIDEFWALVDLQKKMLEFAEANSVYTDAAFKAFVPSEFVDWVIDLRINGKKDSRKAATDFLKDLVDYVKFPLAEKSQVLADFVHDQDYFAQLDNPSFSFHFLPGNSSAHEKATGLLVKFYIFLGEGYPPELVGHPSGTAPFTKHDVIVGYKRTNPSLEYICPCCDNAFTDNPRTVGGQGYTIEHYFPKSLYPSLSLHPMNLIPMCNFCNDIKGNVDPLNPLPLPIILSISYAEMFHPYSRPVRGLAKLEVITNPACSESMEFIAKNPPPTYKPSIDSYSIMYQIPDRWNKNRARVDGRITLYIKRVQKRFNGVTIDDKIFDQILQESIQELEEGFGIDHLSYPAAHWLAWARVNKFQDLKNSFLTL